MSNPNPQPKPPESPAIVPAVWPPRVCGDLTVKTVARTTNGRTYVVVEKDDKFVSLSPSDSGGRDSLTGRILPGTLIWDPSRPAGDRECVIPEPVPTWGEKADPITVKEAIEHFRAGIRLLREGDEEVVAHGEAFAETIYAAFPYVRENRLFVGKIGSVVYRPLTEADARALGRMG